MKTTRQKAKARSKTPVIPLGTRFPDEPAPLDDVATLECLYQGIAAAERAETCRAIIEKDGELVAAANGGLK
jgi:hypothetical protein